MSIDLHKKLIYIDYSGIDNISLAILRYANTFYPLPYDFTVNMEHLVYQHSIEYVFRK
jgi:hypothetical protein